jgi:hypothetical protein
VWPASRVVVLLLLLLLLLLLRSARPQGGQEGQEWGRACHHEQTRAGVAMQRAISASASAHHAIARTTNPHHMTLNMQQTLPYLEYI